MLKFGSRFFGAQILSTDIEVAGFIDSHFGFLGLIFIRIDLSIEISLESKSEFVAVEVLRSSILIFGFLYYRQGSVSSRSISSTDLYFVLILY